MTQGHYSVCQYQYQLSFSRGTGTAKNRHEAEFIRDRANVQKALLAAQNSKLVQQFADVQKHITIICRSKPDYFSSIILTSSKDSADFVVVFYSPFLTM